MDSPKPRYKTIAQIAETPMIFLFDERKLFLLLTQNRQYSVAISARYHALFFSADYFKAFGVRIEDDENWFLDDVRYLLRDPS